MTFGNRIEINQLKQVKSLRQFSRSYQDEFQYIVCRKTRASSGILFRQVLHETANLACVPVKRKTYAYEESRFKEERAAVLCILYVDTLIYIYIYMHMAVADVSTLRGSRPGQGSERGKNRLVPGGP